MSEAAPVKAIKKVVDAEAVYVEPINESQQQEVIDATLHYIDLASQLYKKSFSSIPVLFDLKGRAAGMYAMSGRGRRAKRKIRYNPWLFGKYYQDNLRDTVPHEVAHYIAEQLYGTGGMLNKIRPHGQEWRGVMAAFGADDSVTSQFDLTGIPCRRQQTFSYRCDCREHQLGSRRHKKVALQRASYHCRYCGGALVSVVSQESVDKAYA